MNVISLFFLLLSCILTVANACRVSQLLIDYRKDGNRSKLKSAYTSSIVTGICIFAVIVNLLAVIRYE